MRSPIQNVLFLGLFNINCNTIYIKIQILPKIKVTQNQGFMPYLNPTGKKDIGKIKQFIFRPYICTLVVESDYLSLY